MLWYTVMDYSQAIKYINWDDMFCRNISRHIWTLIKHDYSLIYLLLHRSVSYATGAQVIKMCLSVGIIFVARKIWPSARLRNMFVSTCVDMRACLHICIWVCMLAVIPSCVHVRERVCVYNVYVYVWERERGRWWKRGDSAWRQQPPHCGGWTRGQTPVFPKMNYETKPSACYSPHSWQGQRPEERQNEAGITESAKQEDIHSKKAWRLWVLVYFKRLSHNGE